MLNQSIKQYQPTGVKTTPGTAPVPPPSQPKTVLAKPPTPPTLYDATQKLAQEIQETPFLNTQILNQELPSVYWRTAVIIGVGAFFLGAFLSMIAMFWLY